ncbi:MAG: hypothetical protein ACTHKK_11795, partial [Candidatus Nitrosocosmicus sp.]
STQSNANTGSNTANQGAAGGAGGASNSANQGIGQSNTNTQNAMCVGGTSISGACNNTSTQSNANTGSNTANQGAAGGAGGASNSANQGISQQNNNQQSALCVAGGHLSGSCQGPNAQCVSGASAQVACDQEAFNKLVNSGKSATANLTTK